MASREQIEKVRQGLMRFQELLEILREELEQGEAAYRALFADDIPDTLPEKERQSRAAETLVDDPSELGQAALHMRFVARNLERDFEQVYDKVMTE